MGNQSEPQGKMNLAVDFSNLILGLSSSALHFMGVGIHGEQGKSSNPELAKQHIEILKMLKQKTKGNLAEDEDQLLLDIIQDLEMKYKDLKIGS